MISRFTSAFYKFLPALLISTMLTGCLHLEKAASPHLETNASLARPPAGAIALTTGAYHSQMLDRKVPFRVFSPVDPSWKKATEQPYGMRIVVYVMNLKGVPRPSGASDRAIISELIGEGFLVVTVDYENAEMQDHLSFQKDVNGLFVAFGGQWHTEQGWYTANRKELLEWPGPNKDLSFTSSPYPGKSMSIPINRAGIYVIPSGYTVEPHLVYRTGGTYSNWDDDAVDSLFMDIVYPKKSDTSQAVPILLEGSSSARSEYVVNANTVILYSWLFNGYAFASMRYVKMTKTDRSNSQIHAVRYLRAQKERFSLSGKVGTAGISKAGLRCYVESNMGPRKGDGTTAAYDHEASHVSVCMPAVGGVHSAYANLNEATPGLVNSWCKLDRRQGPKLEQLRQVRDLYPDAGMGDRILHLESPKAGHEYNVYHLNEIMAFFDRFCK